MITKNENPSVYVGTYKKYNEGSLFGAYVDLSKFENKDDFIKFCYELHQDEKDPELMFQDYEYFPSEFYNESRISNKLWDWFELDETQQEIINSFIKCFGTDFSEALQKYEDAYMGHYDTFREFVEQLFDETNEIPDHLIHLIDYDAVEREFGHYYVGHDGHVFDTNW